jgi:hypothetical protein
MQGHHRENKHFLHQSTARIPYEIVNTCIFVAINDMIPFQQSIPSFVNYNCTILFSSLMNFAKFIEHDRPFEYFLPLHTTFMMLLLMLVA